MVRNFSLFIELGLHFLPKNLKSLNVSFCNITDTGIFAIPSTVTDLDVFCCSEITGWYSNSVDILDNAIFRLPIELKRLNLYGCNRLSQAGITSLPSKLEGLSLDFHLSVTDSVIPKLPT